MKIKFASEKAPDDVPELVVEVSVEATVVMLVELDEGVVKNEVVDELSKLDVVEIVVWVALSEDVDEAEAVLVELLRPVMLVVDADDELGETCAELVILVEEVLAALPFDIPLEVDDEAEDGFDRLVDVVAVDVPGEDVEAALTEELVVAATEVPIEVDKL